MANTFQPGGGNSLPANSAGYLNNDGSGTLTWSTPSGTGVNSTFPDIVATNTSIQRAGVATDNIYDAYYTGFASGITQQIHYLLENYTAGSSTIRMSLNAISPADIYTQATSGWSIQAQGFSLVLNGTTFKIGTSGCIQFSKNTGGTLAFLSRTPTGSYLGNNTKHAFWFNMPSVTGLSSIFFRLGVDSSNYQQWNFNTSGTPTEAGSSILANWNFFLQDISSGSTTVGTGWNYQTTIPGYYAIGVEAKNTQGYTGMLVDALTFGDSSGLGTVIGNELSIWNATTKDSFIIDSTTTRTTGTVTIASAPANGYTASSAAFIQRTTLNVPTNGFAGQLPSSGYGGTSAEQRQTLNLQTAASGSNIEAFADIYQGYFYPITTVTAGSSAAIIVNAGSDIHTFYANPSTLEIFQPLGDSNGNVFYKQRTGQSYTSNGTATNSSGSITVPMNTVANIAVGDYALKRCIDLQLSTTQASVNESYSSMSLQRIQVINPALAIPDPVHLYGYWSLSGAAGLNNAISNTLGNNIAVTGTVVSTNANYFNGKFSSGSYTTSNYYGFPNAGNISGAPADCSSMAVSLWFNAPQNSANRNVFSVTGGTNNGHFLLINSSNGVGLAHATNTADVTATSGAWTASAWTHVYYYIDNAPIQKLWVNGVFIGSAASTYTSPGAVSANIGINGTIAQALTNGFIADVVVWRSNAVLSSAQISTLYNNGVPPVLLGANTFRYNYLNSSVTAASQIEAKAILTKVTSSEVTQMRQFAFGRRS